MRGHNSHWYQNITANPDAAIHVDGQRVAVHAVPVTDEALIARLSNNVLRKYRGSPSAKSMVRQEILSTTVAKIWNYPLQCSAIHSVEEKRTFSETTGGMQNQANQDSNTSFPKHSGGYQNPSAATATPSLHQCMTQA